MRVTPSMGSSGDARTELPFTDRATEADVFAHSLASFRVLLDDPHEVRNGRENILTFFGEGGIGKSSLSMKLQEWVEQQSMPNALRWLPHHGNRMTLCNQTTRLRE